MPNRPVVIESFRDLPGIAEIVGFGMVRPPRGGAQEAEIEVLLGSDMDRPGLASHSDMHVVWVGCGQLGMLAAGSRWRQGLFVGRAEEKSITATFELIPGETIGHGADRLSIGGRSFPAKPISAAPGFLLRQVATGTGGSTWKGWKPPKLVLLPQMEFLRGLFGVSSGFLLELFDGIRNPAVSDGRGLVSRSQSHARGDGRVVLEAGRKLSRDEGLIAAAMIADDKVCELHDSVFQQLSVSFNWRAGLPEFINLHWIWQTPIALSLEGRWVERVGRRPRFIATRMSAIGVPLPFSRVEVHHPGSDGSGREYLPAPAGRMRPANARVVLMTTGLAASPSRTPMEILTKAVDLSTASDIEVVSVPHGRAARNDLGGIGEDPRDEASFGTGGRQSGADPAVGSAATRRKRGGPYEATARSQTVALKATWDALQTACRSGGWALDALPISNESSRTAPHGGLDLLREPLVARVAYGTGRVLLVDRGSPAGDECSLGILVPKNSNESDETLAVSARKASEAVRGRWRSPMVHAPDFHVRPVPRPLEVWQDASAYATLLERRIASVLCI